MDGKPSKASNVGLPSFSIRFKANDDFLKIPTSLQPPPTNQPQPSPNNTNNNNQPDESNWKRDFLQGSFFNRKRSNSIEGNQINSTQPPISQSTSSNVSTTANNTSASNHTITTSSNLDTWTRIKGKVNQAMEDIKSNNNQRDSAKSSAAVKGSTPVVVPVQVSSEITPIATPPLPPPSATINSHDHEPESINSLSEEYLDPDSTINKAEDNDPDNSDNDVDSEIFNIDELATTASKLRRSLNNFKHGDSIKAMLKPKGAADNNNSPKGSPVKTLSFLKGSLSKREECNPVAVPVPTPQSSPKKDFEIESGVEMLEDMVLPAQTESNVSHSMDKPDSEPKNRRNVAVPTVLPLVDNSVVDKEPASKAPMPLYLEHSSVTSANDIWSTAIMPTLQSRQCMITVLFIAILVATPLPPFVQGILTCLLTISLMSTINALTLLLLVRNNPRGPEICKFQVPDYKRFPICEVPAAEEHGSLKVYTGWLNEINNYDPNNYHIAMTKTVFIKLSGSRLRVSNVANRISKRALWNETLVDKDSMIITRNRVFNLLNCRVEMCPKGLARKRYFNRKYPIQLIIPNGPVVVPTTDHPLPPLCTNHDQSKGGMLTPDSKKDSDADSLDLDDHYQDVDNEITTTILNADSSSLHHLDTRELVGPAATSKEEVTPNSEETRLLLFARSDREKEDWYRRFLAASRGIVMDSDHVPDVMMLEEKQMASLRQGVPPLNLENLIDGDVPEIKAKDCDAESNDGSDRLSSSPFEGLLINTSASRCPTDYVKFMAKYQQACQVSHTKQIPVATPVTPADKKTRREKKEDDLWRGIDQSLFLGPATNVIWANILIGRVLYSCLNDAILLAKIQEFLQKKLSAIKLPNFMEDVNIAQICLGDQPPLVHRISQPILDERGTWIDADVTYEGLIHATVTTKVNLLRLRRQQQNQQNYSMGVDNPNLSNSITPPSPSTPANKRHSPKVNRMSNSVAMSSIYDSDAESTGGSSSDSESPTRANPMMNADSATQTDTHSGSSSRKLLRIVDRIAASNLFQSATEISYVQRVMENMSTKITLRVELKGLVARVAVNIPPPPSDRIWFGFRGPPRLWITAKPALGEHTVDWSIVTNGIENKLCEEVYKYLVFPNMVDIIAPFLGQSTYTE